MQTCIFTVGILCWGTIKESSDYITIPGQTEWTRNRELYRNGERMSVAKVLSAREDAIVVKGEGSLERGLELLETYGLPKGILMPCQNVEEAGGVEETGQIWLKQKSSIKHHFKLADSFVSYAPEISCKLEKNRMKDIKGVKARRKYMPLMLPILEIVVDPPKIYFKSYGNVSESFPIEFFNGL